MGYLQSLPSVFFFFIILCFLLYIHTVIRMTVDSFTRENEFTMYTTVNVIDVLVHTDILIPTGEVRDNGICQY